MQSFVSAPVPLTPTNLNSESVKGLGFKVSDLHVSEHRAF